MAKKKKPQKAVSRRETVVAKPKPKKVPKKVKTVTKVSEAVKAVEDELSKLSKLELEYYDRVVNLVNQNKRDSVMAIWAVGAELLDCKRKFPKTGADEIIRRAVGISDSDGRNYRRLAEVWGKEELLECAQKSNPKTKWTPPWTTFLTIARVAPTKKARATIFKAVIAEQLSTPAIIELYGNNLVSETTSSNTISSVGFIRKISAVSRKSSEAFDQLEAIIEDLRSPDVITNHRDDLLKAIDSMTQLSQSLNVSLEHLRELQDEIPEEIEEEGEEIEDDGEEFDDDELEDDELEDEELEDDEDYEDEEEYEEDDED